MRIGGCAPSSRAEQRASPARTVARLSPAGMWACAATPLRPSVATTTTTRAPSRAYRASAGETIVSSSGWATTATNVCVTATRADVAAVAFLLTVHAGERAVSAASTHSSALVEPCLTTNPTNLARFIIHPPLADLLVEVVRQERTGWPDRSTTGDELTPHLRWCGESRRGLRRRPRRNLNPDVVRGDVVVRHEAEGHPARGAAHLRERAEARARMNELGVRHVASGHVADVRTISTTRGDPLAHEAR